MSPQESLLEKPSTFVIEPWDVILLNDDRHTFEEVIFQLQRATGCSAEKASEFAWTVHTQGEAVCFTGPKERCEHVASILEQIGLKTRLDK